MLEPTVDVEGIYLHGRLTTHGAAESQRKWRRSIEILPVELRRNVDEPRGTLCRMALYRADGWKGFFGV
jgi:hypothetical protein